jgi:hypothetical protein
VSFEVGAFLLGFGILPADVKEGSLTFFPEYDFSFLTSTFMLTGAGVWFRLADAA